jgi:threonine dehydratase
MTWKIPTFTDVLKARRQIRPFLKPTALLNYPSLSYLTGCYISVKHENHLPTGAFKVRGGVNLISRLGAEEGSRGVISASTGNHGQSVAYGARLFGVRAIICVPERANPAKVESMRDLGAEILISGRDYDEAREHCEQLAAIKGYRYIHSGNEPLLIAGVATASLEVLEEQPETEVLLVPVGGGSGAAGACIVSKSVNPSIAVIGVQSEAAPAAYRSWKARLLVEDKMNTWAEGLQTRTAFELPQRILWDKLDDFVLASDEEIRQAAKLMIEKTRNLVEGAAAAPLAAALKLKDHLAGKRVVLMCSGGNLSLGQLRELLEG